MNVADVSFAEDAFLVITIRNDSTNEEALILGPVWKSNQRRVPEDFELRFRRSCWYLRDVLGDIRKPRVPRVLVCLDWTCEQRLKNWIKDRLP